MIRALIESRRAARRATFAIAMLRKEAAAMRVHKNRDLARYLAALADLIEGAP